MFKFKESIFKSSGKAIMHCICYSISRKDHFAIGFRDVMDAITKSIVCIGSPYVEC
jgi:hypothetical protein